MTDDLEEVVARIIASDELHTKLRALVIVCGHDHIMGEVLRTPAGLVYCSGARIPVQIVEFPPVVGSPGSSRRRSGLGTVTLAVALTRRAPSPASSGSSPRPSC